MFKRQVLYSNDTGIISMSQKLNLHIPEVMQEISGANTPTPPKKKKRIREGGIKVYNI